MSAVLVLLLAVGAELRSGDVPAESGCSVISGGGSASRTALPGAGVGAKVGQLDAECCHLAGKVLDTLQECLALGE